MRPCRAISARRCCSCRARRRRSPQGSIIGSATRILCCATTGTTRREFIVGGGLFPGPALPLRGEPPGSFLYSDPPAAKRGQSENGARHTGVAPGDLALAGG